MNRRVINLLIALGSSIKVLSNLPMSTALKFKVGGAKGELFPQIDTLTTHHVLLGLVEVWS